MKRKRPRRLVRLAGAWPARLGNVLTSARSLLPLAGFLLACLLPVLLPADWLYSRLWKGYYTVFLPASGREAVREKGPAASAIGPTVSRNTASVRFNTFGGLASVRVAELPTRLDPADPRLDPFLRDVDAYFRSPGGELTYVRTRRGPLLSGLLLRRGRRVLELDPVAVLLRLLLLAGASLLVLLPASVPHLPRWLLGLGLLPWILYVPTGDLRDLLAFLLLFPFWVRAMARAAALQAGTAPRSGAAREGGATRGAGAKAGGRKLGKPKAGKRGRGRRGAGGRGSLSWLPELFEPATAAFTALGPALAALLPGQAASGTRKAAPRARKAAGTKATAAARRTATAARLATIAARRARTAAAVPAVLLLSGVLVFFLAAPGARHLAGILLALAADLCLLAMLPAARRWERSRNAHPLFRALPILGTLRPGTGRRRRGPSVPALVAPAALALLALASAAALNLEARRRDLHVPRLESGGARVLSWEALAALPLSSDPGQPPHLVDFLAHEAYQQSLAFRRPYRFPSPGERVYISSYTTEGTGYAQSRRVARRFPESWLSRTLEAAPAGSVERLLADQGRAAAVRRVGEDRLLRELAPWWRAAAVALFLLACLTASLRSGTRSSAL